MIVSIGGCTGQGEAGSVDKRVAPPFLTICAEPMFSARPHVHAPSAEQVGGGAHSLSLARVAQAKRRNPARGPCERRGWNSGGRLYDLASPLSGGPPGARSAPRELPQGQRAGGGGARLGRRGYRPCFLCADRAQDRVPHRPAGGPVEVDGHGESSHDAADLPARARRRLGAERVSRVETRGTREVHQVDHERVRPTRPSRPELRLCRDLIARSAPGVDAVSGLRFPLWEIPL
jgi:hypothetical protein